MDPNAKQVRENPRRVPIPVKDELKNKIEELENMGVIAKATKPTPWINNMVVVRKHQCLDAMHPNKGIMIRNHYPTPAIGDIARKVTKAKVFSVADSKDGFLQVVMDERSSFLTTFWTPFGSYRLLRMPFGIEAAPKEFQRRHHECLEGLVNIEVIHDDVIIFGSSDSMEEATVSHDSAFKAFFNKYRERGLRLNKKKLHFSLSTVGYMGHILGTDGLQADPEKIKAVCDMPRPTDVQGVRHLIGVVHHLSKFSPQLSTLCEPPRRLTECKTIFDWLPQHDDALCKVKELISKAPVLRYFDVNKEVTIECDISDVGWGPACPYTRWTASSLSLASAYSNRVQLCSDKECSAIVFASERFEHYILGKDVVQVLYDHKPLMAIF